MKPRLRAGACEFFGTALMMVVGVGAIVLFWAPRSPLPRLEPIRVRLFATGCLFATGATLVVYSPLGRTSGGHLNPAVTFAFWRLRRIASLDAALYVVAQTLGAVLGVLIVAWLSGGLGASVELGATRPGSGVTLGVALACEAGITGLLMFVILACLDKPRIAPYTVHRAGGWLPGRAARDGGGADLRHQSESRAKFRTGDRDGAAGRPGCLPDRPDAWSVARGSGLARPLESASVSDLREVVPRRHGALPSARVPLRPLQVGRGDRARG
jgi:glycerol uptake facilitator-like aquaporin